MPEDRAPAVSAPTPAVDACHALLVWLIPQLDKMPRQRRYSLGERLETEVLGILALLVSAAYRRERESLLTDANTRLAVCRHLWRLGLELKVISLKSYEHGATQMVDLGRQIGGWLKSARRSS